MNIIQVHLGLLPIPPNGWGAVEKIIWDYYIQLNKKGITCEIKYLNDITYTDNTIVHVHVANLANECHTRNIPYIFTVHDHHAYLYGKESPIFKENLKAIENSILSTCPSKYLVDYFGSKKLKYFSHAVNTEKFVYKKYKNDPNKLLCVANNGYADNQSYDRKGFKLAIQAAKDLNLPITIAGPYNNKKSFDLLPDDLNHYKNLTKLFDLTESDLIELYNQNSIFIHMSELEAGHPNLTLLEAMSCGLPVIGTFEDTIYDGMMVVSRNLDQLKIGIKTILSDYQSYQDGSLIASTKNSYDTRVDQLINIYDEYTELLFGYKFINVYNNISKINKCPIKTPMFKCSFNDCALIEIENPTNPDQTFDVIFKNNKTNDIVYTTSLKHGWWGKSNLNYYIPYNITVQRSDTHEVVFDYTLNLKNKRVLIDVQSNSLGDQLAWMFAFEQFREVHNCELFVMMSTSKLFERKYPHIKFVDRNANIDDLFAVYKPGWYVDGSTVIKDRHIVDIRKIPLQQVVTDYLGLDYKLEHPRLDFEILNPPINKRYVTIATQSTAQCKYWNNKGGWDVVIEYLKSKNFEVVCIDKHAEFGNPNIVGGWNSIPKNVINHTGDFPLTTRLNEIYHSSFFIGLPSGLSWLSWSIKKPTILISGFSYPYTEFNTPYRVQNLNVCTGCWNDEHFDKSNWMWCPKTKKTELFECSTQITPQMVINKIENLMSDFKLT